MGIKRFDRVFGKNFLDTVPSNAGIYEFKIDGTTIYVGKAKNLRNRIRQYRNVSRQKKHKKIRELVGVSTELTFHVVGSEKEALLLETQLIQELKPQFNIANAFSFMYPALGVGYDKKILYLCYSTHPDSFNNTIFTMHGVYRSRSTTKDAYYSFVRLLSNLGHREPRQCLQKFPISKYTHVSGFRQLDADVAVELSNFLNGKNRNFLRMVIDALLEKVGARGEAEKIQEALDELVVFFRKEASPLKKAKKKSGFKGDFLSQKDRDRIFILARCTD